MDKEELIKKWLDNELNPEELKAFQQLEEYDSFIKLSSNAKFFEAPGYNVSDEFKKIKASVSTFKSRKAKNYYLKTIAKVAAIIVIGFFTYSMFLSGKLVQFETIAGEKRQVELPDESIVEMNAMTVLNFKKEEWKSKREVSLSGEAFFKVAKGSQFDVVTNSGIISVVGTQFSVKSRTGYFEVKCFEGMVKVKSNTHVVALTEGETVRLSNGNLIADETNLMQPSWMDNSSKFKSVSLAEVFAELERQYDIKIQAKIDTTMLFTGSFSHNGLETALKSITLPFNLEYTRENKLITIYKIDQ